MLIHRIRTHRNFGKRERKSNFSFRRIVQNPYFLIMLTFLVLILSGAGLLSIPAMNKMPVLPFYDALYMATTSVCVTGLTVVPDLAAQFTIGGLITIAMLIFVGGLGILTILFFILVSFKVKLSFKHLYLMRETINADTAQKAVKAVIWFGILDLGITLAFAITYFVYFLVRANHVGVELSVQTAIGFALFHAVSAFNNAGMDIFSSMATSLGLWEEPVFLTLTMLEIVIGGIGFVVLVDIAHSICIRKRGLSLHTKTVLVASFLLIFIGWIAVWAAQGFHDINGMQAMFASVTTRTAGFVPYDLSKMTAPAYVVMVVLMFIGASPCSTGGGIKTTTVAIIFESIIDNLRGRHLTMWKRAIDPKKKNKAFLILSLSVVIVVLFTFTVAIIERYCSADPRGLEDVLFEVISAYGTVGLSRCGSAQFHVASRAVICLAMFLGRVGGVTIFSILNDKWLMDEDVPTTYASGNIFIG